MELGGREPTGALGQAAEADHAEADHAEADHAEADGRARWLGAILVAYRDREAMTQARFSRKSEVGRTTISKIENGQLYPSADVRRKLARAMAVEPRDLWRPAGHSPGDHEG